MLQAEKELNEGRAVNGSISRRTFTLMCRPFFESFCIYPCICVSVLMNVCECRYAHDMVLMRGQRIISCSGPDLLPCLR